MCEEGIQRKCKYYNSGFGKNRDGCKYIYNPGICLELKCKDKKCLKRHPKACCFKTECRRRSSCLYKHNKYEDINFEEKIDKLRGAIKE